MNGGKVVWIFRGIILEISKKIGYEQGVAAQLSNIGIIYKDLGKYEEALEKHNEALEVFERVGYIQGEISTFVNLSGVYEALGDKGLSAHYAKKAEELKSAL